ncbi:MAG: DUF2271 domain-containing protein [Spirochaetales bacterium]|nr:DUF2271 domain-containing protein [Spirochaetales bacterium]
MKKKTVIIFMLLLGFLLFGNNKQNKQVEISIQWKQAAGFGSNQCAVWVEDENGNYVKTIYVSKFTGDGGFKKRPACLTLWRSKAEISDFVPIEIDAVTLPTPKNGANLYCWNLTDANNSPVPKGIYYLKVESNLRNEKRAVWTGKIDISKDQDSCDATVEYFSIEKNDAEKENTVTNVSIKYK